MAGWRLAHSLEVLRNEVDTRWPNRSKVSDGTIGDAAHRSQGAASDHNPWVIDDKGVGVVRAFDVTAATIDAPGLAEHLRQLGAHDDARLIDHGYIIFDRRIASEIDAWAWRPYGGADPHTSHIHVSVARDPAGYDSDAAWGVSKVQPAPSAGKVKPMYDPPLQITVPIAASLPCPTGGDWLLGTNGAIFAFDCPNFGAADGKSYFAGRTAARLELRETDPAKWSNANPAYRIVDTAGEGYGDGGFD
jgi:hypothetical protein